MDQYTLIVVIAIVTIGFSGFYFSSTSDGLKNIIQTLAPTNGEKIWWPFTQKLCGFIWMGLLPGLASLFLLRAPHQYYGLGIPKPQLSLFWAGMILLFVLPVVYLKARSAKASSIYPQIRSERWDFSLLGLNALGWGSHLMAYEFLFRGLFLFSCVPIIGLWPAIVLSTALYTIAHIPKGLPETLASIPFGLILGWVTVRTGSIWTAFFIHWLMSQANDWFSIHFQPKMKFQL